jgi:hypothetical protein
MLKQILWLLLYPISSLVYSADEMGIDEGFLPWMTALVVLALINVGFVSTAFWL